MAFTEGNIEPMIANCDVLITQYSTVAYIGLALGKEVHSYFDLDELREMTPIKNGGASSRHIADVCVTVLETDILEPLYHPAKNTSLIKQPAIV